LGCRAKENPQENAGCDLFLCVKKSKNVVDRCVEIAVKSFQKNFFVFDHIIRYSINKLQTDFITPFDAKLFVGV